MSADNKVGLRTEVNFKTGNGSVYKYVFADYVDGTRLARNLKVHAALAKRDGMRPGEVVSESITSLSREKIAVIFTLTPDGNPPMCPDDSSVRFFSYQFPRKFGK